MAEVTEMPEVEFAVGDTYSEDEDGECIYNETVSSEQTDKNTTSSKSSGSTAKTPKRKANSPATDPTMPKRQNSLPNLKQTGLKYPATFNDMVVKSFEDNNCVRVLTPIFNNIVAPLINTALDSAVDRACDRMKTSMFDTMLKAHSDLQEIVHAQSEIIKTQSETINDQQKTINEHSEEINTLKEDVNYLSSGLEKLQVQTNNLEQYGRRNSIRLDNYPCKDTEQENTDSVVKFMNSKILPPPERITSSDIERCHPVGPQDENGKAQLIVKFKSYHTKQKVFSNKRKLKNNPGKIFMSEDLTKANHAIVKALVPLRKASKVNSFWTHNGTVFAKKGPEDVPKRVRSPAEAIELFGA